MQNLILMKSYEKKETGLYGFIDINGNWVIEPTYRDAEEFYYGLAKVSTEFGKYKFINEKNETVLVIDEEERCKVGFRGGLLNVTKEHKEKYIDKNGQVVIGYGITPFRESWFDEHGYLIIEENNKCGVINNKGDIIIKPKYDTILHYSDGVFRAELNGKWGFIDENDNVVIDFKYKSAGKFSEGIADVVTLDNKVGFINKKNEFVIEPKFNAYGKGAITVFSGCSENRILIGEEKLSQIEDGFYDDMLYGYLDKTGEKVIETKFTDGEKFSEGLAMVRDSYVNGEKCGYIDRKGRYVINPVFDLASSFKNNIAHVLYRGQWGYINRNGSWIYKPVGFPFSDCEVWNRE